jgi:hypothetical protein
MKSTVDSELFQLIRDRLFTPVLGDILDRERYWHQFLAQPIKPSHFSRRIVGRAFPVRIADVTGPQRRPQSSPPNAPRPPCYLTTGPACTKCEENPDEGEMVQIHFG